MERRGERGERGGENSRASYRRRERLLIHRQIYLVKTYQADEVIYASSINDKDVHCTRKGKAEKTIHAGSQCSHRWSRKQDR